MKKRLAFSFLAGILFAILISIGLLAIWVYPLPELPTTSKEKGACTHHGINFDFSSIRYIYQNPDAILEDPGLFWKEDPAYKLVAMAPQYAGKSLPPDGWVKHIEKISSLSDQKIEEEKPFVRSAEIIEHADTFCQNALPVILSLLPDDADIRTTVYVTAYNEPAFFVFRGNLVMDAECPTLFDAKTEFFNILSHEIFHIGYFDIQPYQTEVWSNHYPTTVLLTVLQNDGLAVYTQYLVSSLYPKPGEFDFLI